MGTAFLMAVVGGALVKDAIAERAAARHHVGRRATLLRGQVGRLAGKRLLVLAADPSPIERAFVRSLVEEHEAVVSLRGAAGLAIDGDLNARSLNAGVDAVVCLGSYGPLLKDTSITLPPDQLVLAFGASSVAASTLALPGDRIRHLRLAPSADEIAESDRQRLAARHRTFWIVGAAMLIMTICIANAMLMSVTERIREIGTMKCLGALSSFVVKLFLIESALIGVGGAVAGVAVGTLFAIGGYASLYGLAPVITALHLGQFLLSAAGCVLAGIVLATIAGIYPARVASKMIPAAALASHV